MVIGCLRLSDVCIICCVVNPRRRHRKVGVSCTECTGLGNKFELIPMVEIKMIHPAEGFLVANFRQSYGGLKSQDVNFLKNFFRFSIIFGKTTPYG